ncbi:MAG TPA: flagellar regulator YcgR PilZN domain-containing protein [Armatimonadota bacterium]|nr:flagellar regulator YcgR PilZN domain-containing protein [Armatimonadota bacterium]
MSLSLNDDKIEERYFLHGQMEILSVLNELIHRREGITVYFTQGQEFLRTTLLEARPTHLVFDLSGDENTNRRFEHAEKSLFVGHLDGIRVQFFTTKSTRFSWGGSDAFWTPLPTRVIRLQRRESYRVLLPVTKPIPAQILSTQEKRLGEWPMHDLSVGGLAFTVTGELGFQPGDGIGHLVFVLAKRRKIECMATVRHVTPVNKQAGEYYRIGVSFLDLPASLGGAIQRYILDVEHQRRGAR